MINLTFAARFWVIWVIVEKRKNNRLMELMTTMKELTLSTKDVAAQSATAQSQCQPYQLKRTCSTATNSKKCCNKIHQQAVIRMYRANKATTNIGEKKTKENEKSTPYGSSWNVKLHTRTIPSTETSTDLFAMDFWKLSHCFHGQSDVCNLRIGQSSNHQHRILIICPNRWPLTWKQKLKRVWYGSPRTMKWQALSEAITTAMSEDRSRC